MEPIKDTLCSVLHALEAKAAERSTEDPMRALKKILTKKELGHIRVSYSKTHALYLNTDSSALLYQLNIQKEKILAEIRTLNPRVRELRIVLGKAS